MMFKKMMLIFVVLLLCYPAISLAQKSGPIQSLQDQINSLQNQINNIQLTPGPQGPVGSAGPPGPQGPQGPKGDTGPAGSYNFYHKVCQNTDNCHCVSPTDLLVSGGILACPVGSVPSALNQPVKCFENSQPTPCDTSYIYTRTAYHWMGWCINQTGMHTIPLLIWIHCLGQ